MCGIAGIWAPDAPRGVERVAARMAGTLRHRGPDAGAEWADTDVGLALGHRRLAVVELSEFGAQPMRSACGRYVLCYNGEIYNHLEIRRELEANRKVSGWRGGSDTETLLAAFVAWGVEDALERAVGMFALALWDRQERRLTLARDRFGEKPLYFGWAGEGPRAPFVFGSELKALRAAPGFDNEIDSASLAGMLQFSALPGPRTIYQGIRQLPPGTTATIDLAGHRSREIAVAPFWTVDKVARDGLAHPYGDEDEALEALAATLATAIRDQVIADVRVGAFLSGGVDSSLIVALMQSMAASPVKTFTIAFDQKDLDESPYAAAVARHLGTEHHELSVTARDAIDLIPRLPQIYDEPFADSSQIPTYFVCRAAREQVTVALSGDGGDELFGGYNRYVTGAAMWRRFSQLPPVMRHAAGSALLSVPGWAWDAPGKLAPAGKRISLLGDKVQKFAIALVEANSLDEFYLSVQQRWPAGQIPLLGGAGESAAETAPAFVVEDPVARMMLLDSVGYLPNDILTKVDRAAMAVSLETRAPFLDHRVAALAWRLPADMKVRGRKGKWALRQLLDRHVPPELIERPKAGFAVPLAEWLRGPLRDWASDLLDERRLAEQGYLCGASVTAMWREHLSARRDWSARLWSVLMFQAWFDANIGSGIATGVDAPVARAAALR